TDHGLLERFPGRTEADLYLFLSEHRGRLEQRLGYGLSGQQLAEGLVGPADFESQRAADDLRSAVRHGRLVAGSESGLLGEIMVLLSGDEDDDSAQRAALAFAVDEAATVFGLWIGPGEAAEERSRRQAVFNRACVRQGVRGQLAFADGDRLKAVLTRAVYVDLVVTTVPTAGQRVAWLRLLLNRCPKPLYLLKGPVSRSQRP